MTNKRKIDPEGVRTAIEDAARDLFIERGYHNTSMKQLAERAGVTKSLIHHHFGTKEGLWKHVKGHMMRIYFEAQRGLVTSDLEDLALFRESLQLYFHFLRQRPKMARLMAWMNLEQDWPEPDVDPSDDLIPLAVKRIAQGQEHGALRSDVRAEYILMMFFLLIEPWFVQKKSLMDRFDLHDRDPDDLDQEWLSASTKLFLAAVRPPP